MNIGQIAIEKNRITWTALLIILLGGLWSYFKLPRAEDPGFIIRTAMVQTYFPGASPERMESLITDKLEKSIQEMPELDNVKSESRTGVSLIHVNIKERYTNLRPIWDSLRRKVEQTIPKLPDGIIGPVVNDEFGDVFGVVLALTGEGFSYGELKEIADDVRDELLRIDEVAKVETYGAQEERIFVEYNNAQLSEMGMTAYQLKNILESQNIIIPGGAIQIGTERIVLEPTGNFESIEQLKRTVVSIPGVKELNFLGDFVNIYRGYVDPPQKKARASGRDALALAISMRDGGNIIKLGEQVQQAAKKFQAQYPIGVNFDFVAFQPQDVERKVNDFVSNLLQSIVIVLLVMLLTLGFRTGMLVSSLIPSAMLMSLFFMSFFDIGLDQVSLASLIIALGMLVDNSIVMSESIMVQSAAGKSVKQAAIDSVRELQIPLLTSSLTTSAAFLPIFLAESITGEYTAPLFKVVTITLLCSWVLSLTMIPLLCVAFLKIKKKEETVDGPLYLKYKALLQFGLKHRYVSLVGVVAIFVLSLSLLKFIPQIFFPPSDKLLFTAKLSLPMGTRVEETEKTVKEIESFIQSDLRANNENAGITRWVSYIGEGGPRFVGNYTPKISSPEYAFLLFQISDLEALTPLVKKLEDFCFEFFPDLRITLTPLNMGPPVDSPIAVRLMGKDLRILYQDVKRTKDYLATIPGTKNITDDWGAKSKKLLVNVNQARANRAQISNRDIAIALQTSLSGFETTQFREDDKVIPVLLRSSASDRHDLRKLESLIVVSPTSGLSIPLKQLADIEVVWQPSKILRRNRLKTITVEADLQAGHTAAAINQAVLPWLGANIRKPTNFQIGGTSEESMKANASIAEKLPIAALIILLLLVAQFNSIRRPIIIILTIPLGMIGVIIGLIIGQSYFGFMTLLGIISLSGIVINNAIVLLDRIKIEIEENGLAPNAAIIQASLRRLRPILLTTATTIGGLLPLWIGGGLMWEPMAIAIIFGLAFATFLTLGLVPILYAILFKVR